MSCLCIRGISNEHITSAALCRANVGQNVGPDKTAYRTGCPQKNKKKRQKKIPSKNIGVFFLQKTTPIGRVAVGKTGISRQNWVSIKGPLKLLNTIVL